jgi:hypothetical protein
LGPGLYGWGWPYYDADYGYGPTDAFGVSDVAFGDGNVAFGDGDIATSAPPRASSCHHNVETITVPSEDGGTRQIRIFRC